MGLFDLFKKKTKKDYSSFEGNIYDLRSYEEKRIAENSDQSLRNDLEDFAEEILGALIRGDFDQYDPSKIVYWDKSDNCAKGLLRDKAKSIGNLNDLQRVYYRVVHLANERRVNIVERYISVLFDGIDGWMD